MAAARDARWYTSLVVRSMAGQRTNSLAEQLSHRLQSSRTALMDAITGMDDTSFRARTEPGVWTPAELLAHLLSTERIFIDRARRTVERDDYTVTPVADDIRSEHIGMAQRMPVPQLVHGLLAQRRDTASFVASLSDEDLARTLNHPVRGEQTASWQIEHAIEHEMEHAAEIQARRLPAKEEST